MPRLGELQDYPTERAFTRRAPGVNPIALELDRLAALRHIPTRTALQPEDERAQDEAYANWADEEAMRREAPQPQPPQPQEERTGGRQYTDADFSQEPPRGELGRLWRRNFRDLGREDRASDALASLFTRGDVWLGDEGDFYSYFPMNSHQFNNLRQTLNNMTPEQKNFYLSLQPGLTPEERDSYLRGTQHGATR